MAPDDQPDTDLRDVREHPPAPLRADRVDGIDRFDGAITASAFASGDAVVVGAWARSPLGMFIDVMWRRPDGRRVLLAPTEEIADYVANLYTFDEVHVASLRGRVTRDAVAVADEGGALDVRMAIGPQDWRSWLFALRPGVLRRSRRWAEVEDVLARPFVGLLLGGGAGVRATGTAPGGQREWYGAHDWRPLVSASLRVDGEDRGGMRDMPADLGVGLSAFPARPASVRVTTQVQARSGPRREVRR